MIFHSNGKDTVKFAALCCTTISSKIISSIGSFCFLPNFISSTDLHCRDGRIIAKAYMPFKDSDGDSSYCIGADNIMKGILFANAGMDTTICPNDSIRIGEYAQTGIKYFWTSKPAGFTSTLADPKVAVSVNTTYFLNISGPPGSGSDSVIIKLKPAPAANAGINDTICARSSASIGAAAITGNSYAWTSSPAGFSSTSSYPAVSPFVTTKYFLKEIITATGCFRKDSVSIIVNPLPLAKTGIDETICSGASTSIGYNAIPSNKYSWTSSPLGFTSSQASPLISPAVTTVYKLVEITPAGCKDSGFVTITIDTACVWPGDANRDKIVNNKDLLNLGIGYGTLGKIRKSGSKAWVGQPALDWKDTFAYNVNYKHADCDGDSIINFTDTLAISANYSKTHLKTYSANQGSPTDPHLTIVLSKDSAQAGEVVKADIMYGNSSSPASNVYGLAFSVIYPAGMMDTVMTDFSGSWLSSNKLDLSKIASAGQLDMAVVRTDQKDTSGFGKLATLYFKLGANLPTSFASLNISIAENTQINSKAQYKPVFMQSDSILVKKTFTGITAHETTKLSGISLFPNPANTELLIRFSEAMPVSLSLKDMTGKEVTMPQYFNVKEYKMNTSGLPSGIYCLNISSEQSVITRKIVIQH